MNSNHYAPSTLPAWCYTTLWQAWLLGLLLSAAFGWIWCLLAPSASLLVLYRQALLTSRHRATAPRSGHRPALRPVRRGH
jgi:hypothetical protein